MIASLRGIVIVREPGRVILEVAGVGYEVSVPIGSFDQIPHAGGEIFVFVEESTAMYGGGTKLYGFLTLDQQRIFGKLRDVPGIGAKKAMEYLDKVSHSLPRFRKSVQEKDLAAMTSLFGFTRKTAEKLVISLKDSLADLPLTSDLSGADSALSGAAQEAMAALIQLGFKELEARRALEQVGPDSDLERSSEQLIREALKELRLA